MPLLNSILKPAHSTPLIRGELNDYELGLLIGVIESEGSIGFSLTRKGNSRYPYPFISVSNTSIDLLKKVSNLLGVDFKKRDWTKSKGKGKQVYGIYINRTLTVYETLKKISALLISKKEAAELVIKWCNLHLQRLTESRRCPPNGEELKIILQVWKLTEHRYPRFQKTRSLYLSQIGGS